MVSASSCVFPRSSTRRSYGCLFHGCNPHAGNKILLMSLSRIKTQRGRNLCTTRLSHNCMIMKTMQESYSTRKAGREVRSFISRHVEDIAVDDENKTIRISIDKKYNLNSLYRTPFREKFDRLLKEIYGEEYVIRFGHHPHDDRHDREMLVPRKIRRS